MTVDTATVRRRMGAISIFRRATDDHATITRGASVVTEIVRETVPALCDALEAERERTRVLTEALRRTGIIPELLFLEESDEEETP